MNKNVLEQQTSAHAELLTWKRHLVRCCTKSCLHKVDAKVAMCKQCREMYYNGGVTCYYRYTFESDLFAWLEGRIASLDIEAERLIQ